MFSGLLLLVLVAVVSAAPSAVYLQPKAIAGETQLHIAVGNASLPLKNGSGIAIVTRDGGVTLEHVRAEDVAFDGSNVTLPVLPLIAGKTYTVTVPADFFRDAQDRPFVGVADWQVRVYENVTGPLGLSYVRHATESKTVTGLVGAGNVSWRVGDVTLNATVATPSNWTLRCVDNSSLEVRVSDNGQVLQAATLPSLCWPVELLPGSLFSDVTIEHDDERLWVVTGGSLDDSARSIQLDDDTAFVLGVTYSNVFLGETGHGGSDMFVSAWSTSSGALLWAHVFGSVNDDVKNRVSTDIDRPRRQVYLAGYTSGPSFGEFTTKGLDGVVIALDYQGRELWRSFLSASGTDVVYSLCVNETGSGEIYVPGYTYGVLFGVNGAPPAGFLAKLRPDNGSVTWGNLVPSTDYVSACTVVGDTVFAGIGEGSQAGVAAVRSNGSLLWADLRAGVEIDNPRNVAVYGDRVYVAAYTSGGAGDLAALLLQWATNGTFLTSSLHASAGTDGIYGILISSVLDRVIASGRWDSQNHVYRFLRDGSLSTDESVLPSFALTTFDTALAVDETSMFCVGDTAQGPQELKFTLSGGTDMLFAFNWPSSPVRCGAARYFSKSECFPCPFGTEVKETDHQRPSSWCSASNYKPVVVSDLQIKAIAGETRLVFATNAMDLPLKLGTGIAIVTRDGGVTLEHVRADDVAFDGSNVTLPVLPLIAGKTYTMTVPADFFRDAQDRPFVGVADWQVRVFENVTGPLGLSYVRHATESKTVTGLVAAGDVSWRVGNVTLNATVSASSSNWTVRCVDGTSLEVRVSDGQVLQAAASAPSLCWPVSLSPPVLFSDVVQLHDNEALWVFDGGAGSDKGQSISVVGDDAFVFGWTDSHPFLGDAGIGGMDVFVSKWSASTGALQWMQLLGSAGDDYASIDSSDVHVLHRRMFVGGRAAGDVFDGDWHVTGTYDGFVMAYDFEGRRLWRTIINGSGSETVLGVCVNATADTSELFVVGHADTDLGGGANQGGPDAFVARLDPLNGDVLWIAVPFASSNSDQANVCHVAGDRIYISGRRSGNFALAEADKSGAILWMDSYGIPGLVHSRGLAVHGDYVYVSGDTADDNSTLLTWWRNGTHLRTTMWGPSPGTNYANEIAVSTVLDRLLVAGRLDQTFSVTRLFPNGSLTGEPASLPSISRSATDIALSPDELKMHLSGYISLDQPELRFVVQGSHDLLFAFGFPSSPVQCGAARYFLRSECLACPFGTEVNETDHQRPSSWCSTANYKPLVVSDLQAKAIAGETRLVFATNTTDLPLKRGSGITIVTRDDGVTLEHVRAEDVTFDGSNVTLPVLPLIAGKTYTVTVPADFFRDAQDRPFVGVADWQVRVFENVTGPLGLSYVRHATESKTVTGLVGAGDVSWRVGNVTLNATVSAPSNWTLRCVDNSSLEVSVSDNGRVLGVSWPPSLCWPIELLSKGLQRFSDVIVSYDSEALWALALHEGTSATRDSGEAIDIQGDDAFVVGYCDSDDLMGRPGLGNSDMFVSRWSVSTGALLWMQRVGSSGDDYPLRTSDVISRAQRHVYLAGRVDGPVFDGDWAIQGPRDGVVVAFDFEGRRLWRAIVNTSSDDRVHAVCVNRTASAELFAVGLTYGSPTSGFQNQGRSDGFVAKLEPTSGEILWVLNPTVFASAADDSADICTVSGSHIFVAGLSINSSSVGVSCLGASGEELWNSSITSASTLLVGGVALDAECVFVSVRSDGSLSGFQFEGVFDAFVFSFYKANGTRAGDPMRVATSGYDSIVGLVFDRELNRLLASASANYVFSIFSFLPNGSRVADVALRPVGRYAQDISTSADGLRVSAAGSTTTGIPSLMLTTSGVLTVLLALNVPASPVRCGSARYFHKSECLPCPFGTEVNETDHQRPQEWCSAANYKPLVVSDLQPKAIAGETRLVFATNATDLPLKLGSGIAIVTRDGGVTLEHVRAEDVAFDGSNVTLPVLPLIAGKTYTVTVPADFFRDAQDRPFVGANFSVRVFANVSNGTLGLPYVRHASESQTVTGVVSGSGAVQWRVGDAVWLNVTLSGSGPFNWTLRCEDGESVWVRVADGQSTMQAAPSRCSPVSLSPPGAFSDVVQRHDDDALAVNIVGTMSSIQLAGDTAFVTGITYAAGFGDRDVTMSSWSVSTGALLWQHAVGSPGLDTTTFASQLVDTDLRRTYVQGYCSASPKFDGDWSPQGLDGFVLAYDFEGRRLWRTMFSSSGTDDVRGLCVANGKSLFATGFSTGSLNGHTNAGSSDAFLAKLDPINGNVLWTRFVFETDAPEESYRCRTQGEDVLLSGVQSSKITLAKLSQDTGQVQWASVSNQTGYPVGLVLVEDRAFISGFTAAYHAWLMIWNTTTGGVLKDQIYGPAGYSTSYGLEYGHWADRIVVGCYLNGGRDRTIARFLLNGTLSRPEADTAIVSGAVYDLALSRDERKLYTVSSQTMAFGFAASPLRCSFGEYFLRSECLPCPFGTAVNETDHQRPSSWCQPVLCRTSLSAFVDRAQRLCLPCPPNTTTNATSLPHDVQTCSVTCTSRERFNSTAHRCEPCPAGFFSFPSPHLEPSCPNSCPDRLTRLDEEAAKCVDCPTGTFTSATGAQSSCAESCPGGSVLVPANLSCSTCQPGSYSNQPQTACTLCEEGKFGPSPGASACTPCPGSTFHYRTGETSNEVCQCELCPPGRFADASQSGYCEKCPPGTFTQHRNESECATCTLGTYSTGNGATTCLQARQGFIAPLINQVEEACPPGRFSNATGLSVCSLCPAGRSSAAASSACSDCEAGKASNTSGGVCKDCLPGTYSQSGWPLCKNCSAGAFAPAAKATECLACSAGRFASEPGMSDCASCEVGRFANTSGLAECFTCPPGTDAIANRATGAVACTPCVRGTRSVNGTCVSCQPGFFSNAPGSSTCGACPNGTWTLLPGSVDCLDCQQGRFANSTGTSECLQCPAGRFAGQPGQAECDACDPGRYATGGAVACLLCPSGKYVTGAAGCAECPVGRFAREEGSMHCDVCTRPLYSTENGTANCLACPVGRYAVFDPQDILRWRACEECPEGATCLAGSNVSTSADFYGVTDPRTGEVDTFPCFDGRCKEGGSCSEGRVTPASANPLCGRCVDGHSEWGGACVQCDAPNYGMWVGLLLMLWVVVLVLHSVSQVSTGSLRILIYFWQMAILLSGQRSWLDWASFINMDPLSVGGQTCLSSLAPATKIGVRLASAATCFVMLVVTAVLHRLFGKRTEEVQLDEDSRHRGVSHVPMPYALRHTSPSVASVTSLQSSVWTSAFDTRPYKRSALALYLFTFNLVVQTSLEIFTCIDVAGTRYMVTSPAVVCDSPDHKALVGLAVLSLFVYVAMVPTFLLWRLFQFHADGHLSRKSVRTVYGVLYEPFKPTFYMWGFYALFRRTLLVSLVVSLYADRTMQIGSVLLACVVFLLVQLRIEPFGLPADNKWEFGCLAAITVLAWLLSIDASNTVVGVAVLLPGMALILRTAHSKYESFTLQRKLLTVSRKESRSRASFGDEMSRARPSVVEMGDLDRSPAPASSSSVAELPAEDVGDLPEGWERHETDEGIPYFHHQASGRSEWDPKKIKGE